MRLQDITCISDLYYVIGRWFTLAMFLVAVAAMPFALEISDSVVTFLMCSGIAFVGCAAEYRDESEYPVHVISALVSAVCSVIWVAVTEPWFLLVLAVGFAGFIDRKRWLLWCEVGHFAMVLAVILFALSHQTHS